jgi:hypothetical protein
VGDVPEGGRCFRGASVPISKVRRFQIVSWVAFQPSPFDKLSAGSAGLVLVGTSTLALRARLSSFYISGAANGRRKTSCRIWINEQLKLCQPRTLSPGLARIKPVARYKIGCLGSAAPRPGSENVETPGPSTTCWAKFDRPRSTSSGQALRDCVRVTLTAGGGLSLGMRSSHSLTWRVGWVGACRSRRR